MSEIEAEFRQLNEALSAHFQDKKQTRVNKVELLELLYERAMQGIEGDFLDLVKSYQSRCGATDRDALVRALRRAVNTIACWMRQHYQRFPDHIIKFEIYRAAQLRVRVHDEFRGRSISDLSAELEGLVRAVKELSGATERHIQGTTEGIGTTDLTTTLAELRSRVERLVAVHQALAYRM